MSSSSPSPFNDNSISEILENELVHMFENLTISDTPAVLLHTATAATTRPYQNIQRIFRGNTRRNIDVSNNTTERTDQGAEPHPTDADYYQLLREYNRNIYEYENNIDNLTNLTRTINLMLSELNAQYNRQLSLYQRNVNFILNSQSPSSVLEQFSEDYNNIVLNYQWNMEHFLDILRQLYMNTTELTQNYTNTIRNYQNSVNRFYGRHFYRARNTYENSQPTTTTTTQPIQLATNTLSPSFRMTRQSNGQRRPRLIVPRNRRSIVLNNPAFTDTQATNHPPFADVSTTTIPVGPTNLPTFSTNRQYLDLMSLIFTNHGVGRGIGETDELPPRLSRARINEATRIIRWDTSMNETHCPITWEDFTEGEEIRQIRHCSHIFKNTALLNWLRTHNICPVCRYDLRTFQSRNIASSSSTNTTTGNTEDPMTDDNDETSSMNSENADPETNPGGEEGGEEEDEYADLPDLITTETNDPVVPPAVERGTQPSYSGNSYESFLNMIRNLSNENMIPDYTTQDSSGNYITQYSFEFYSRT